MKLRCSLCNQHTLTARMIPSTPMGAWSGTSLFDKTLPVFRCEHCDEADVPSRGLVQRIVTSRMSDDARKH